MELWNSIRQRVLRDAVSIRQIQRETGLHHQTIKKILADSLPLPFACPKRVKPKLGPYLERIAAILEAEREERLPKKQRRTAKRIFERLREEGYTGGYTQVKEAVRELRRTSQEVFVPLRHDPGEAQVDFGHALIKLQGELTRVAFFVLALPHQRSASAKVLSPTVVTPIIEAICEIPASAVDSVCFLDAPCAAKD